MTICIAGKNKIAVEALKHLIANYTNYNIIACKNGNDEGVNTWQPSLLFFCIKHNIPLVSLSDLYGIKDLLFISLEFDKIIKPEKFESKRLFNIHFSKLPAYKGMYTSILPILFGEKDSAVTLHIIDKRIDAGEIIDQISFPITTELIGRDLYDLFLNHAFTLFKKNITSLIDDKLISYKQPITGSSYFSKSSINFSKIFIDLNKTAYEIHNQIRAFSFREFQLPKVFNEAIYKSKITETVSNDKPGTIIFKDEWQIEISTIDYNIVLFIDKLQEITTAAESGDIESFEKIRIQNYPVEVKTQQGWDALIIASYNNQGKFVKHLIDLGWNINTCNHKGTSALMYAMTAASATENLSALEYLSEVADWTIKDERDKNIFDYADEYNIPKVLLFINKYK